MQRAEAAVAGPLRVTHPQPAPADVAAAAALLRAAQRPLLVVGTGAAAAHAEGPLRELVGAARLPFLATAMGRGVVSDDSPLCANAARSMALAQADVAVVVGSRWVARALAHAPSCIAVPCVARRWARAGRCCTLPTC